MLLNALTERNHQRALQPQRGESRAGRLSFRRFCGIPLIDEMPGIPRSWPTAAASPCARAANGLRLSILFGAPHGLGAGLPGTLITYHRRGYSGICGLPTPRSWRRPGLGYRLPACAGSRLIQRAFDQEDSADLAEARRPARPGLGRHHRSDPELDAWRAVGDDASGTQSPLSRRLR
jgi:hypothetical protein